MSEPLNPYDRYSDGGGQHDITHHLSSSSSRSSNNPLLPGMDTRPLHKMSNVSAVSSTDGALYHPSVGFLTSGIQSYSPRGAGPTNDVMSAASMALTVAPNQLTLTAPSGSGGFSQQDQMRLSHHQQMQSRWALGFPGVGQQHQHQRLSHPQHDAPSASQPHQAGSLQPQQLLQVQQPQHLSSKHSYPPMPLVPQTVSPSDFNRVFRAPQQQQPPPPTYPSTATFGHHQTTHSTWQLPQPTSASNDSTIDRLVQLGSRAQQLPTPSAPPTIAPASVADTTSSSASSALHAVGRQGTRSVLPSAPGTQEAATEEDFEPTQDLESGKWLCPSCPATFSFPKHVKRHYMRHTGERPYECLCCCACFARSDVLKRHYEKCVERTPGFREMAPGSRLDHLHGRRGRPKKTVAKKPTAAKRRRTGSLSNAGKAGSSSRENSRRNSKDQQALDGVSSTKGTRTAMSLPGLNGLDRVT